MVLPALLLFPMPDAQRKTLLGIVALAALYNSLLPWIARRFPRLVMYVSTACDAVASGLFVFVGSDDPQLYIVLFSIVIASSMRLGLGPALVVVALLATLDATSAARHGVALEYVAFRSAFLALTATLSAILYRFAKRGERMLKEANQELKAANERLQQLDEMKSNFISSASHELRTPLTSILAFSEMLTEHPSLSSEAREFAAIVNGESERLSRLVSDMLDLSRIEAGALSIKHERLELAELLHRVAFEQQPLAERKGLRLELEVDPALPPALGDADAIRQVLLNLVNNALKFTPAGAVTIGGRQDAGEACVFVSDTGLGISEDDQQRVFERFYQAGNGLTDKPQGTGLGLTICSDLLNHLGTELCVDSVLGRGSTFSFRLPVAPPSACHEYAADYEGPGVSTQVDPGGSTFVAGLPQP
jgi:signal transduction histidine kinase